MHKNIKLVDLNKLQREGAQVQRPPRQVVVDGLDKIAERIAKLGHDDLLVAVEKLTEVIANKDSGGLEVDIDPVDFSPLIKALENRKFPSYRFKIERDERGRMEYVDAEPKELV